MNEQTNFTTVGNKPHTPIYIWIILVILLFSVAGSGTLYFLQSMSTKEITKSMQTQIASLKNDVAKLQQEKVELTASLQQTQETAQKNTAITTPHKSITLDIPKVTLSFPDSYNITKSTEKNRRGSYSSYDFSNTNSTSTLALTEVQFFSEDSIKKFNESCLSNIPCFMGDYPTVERYTGEKQALLAKKDYTQTYPDGKTKEFKLQQFNGQSFLVSFTFDPNGSVYEYTTFVGDTKIDIWVKVAKEDQKAQSDELFTKFMIKTL
ncbi:TPA: hypothetical protein DCQ85_01820 [Candidatus Magasanikbacteria bacterium]|nr:MAG: hypothetical protein A2507_03085 [Candidatus Magasanikbacteria bacterium RIFOXYD12_FULL_33_17]HAO52184.1 hypothetical protein [Candidatus Magasanikbacteria bacterium]